MRVDIGSRLSRLLHAPYSRRHSLLCGREEERAASLGELGPFCPRSNIRLEKKKSIPPASPSWSERVRPAERPTWRCNRPSTSSTLIRSRACFLSYSSPA